MSTRYLKANLIAELSRTAGISRRHTIAVLDALAQIAYREARAKFTLPGICRLDVIHRQARRARNPATGKAFLVAEHDVLRIRPLRKARLAVTPPPANLIQALPADKSPVSPAPPQTATSDKSPTTADPKTEAAAPNASDASEKFISFRCRACSQEIEAPLDMIGVTSECPSCCNAIKVPMVSEPGTIWGPPLSENSSDRSSASQQDATDETMKNRTIRIELPDDF